MMKKVAPAAEKIINTQIGRQTQDKIFKLPFKYTFVQSIVQNSRTKEFIQKFGYVANSKFEKCNKIEFIEHKTSIVWN